MVDVLWYCVITIYKYVHLASVKSIFFIYVAKQKQHASAFLFPFAGNLDNLLMFSLIQEEPGGQRALIFDQGNRISQVRLNLQ